MRICFALAWDAEGSPFKGTPFDPSKLTFRVVAGPRRGDAGHVVGRHRLRLACPRSSQK